MTALDSGQMTGLFNSFHYFLRLIYLRRSLIASIAARELARQYVGSVLGFVWTFVNPVVMITVFWVVFSLGFKVTPVEGVPFVVWLTAGMAAWFAFADMVNGACGVIVGNPHLIKKTLLHAQILPVVKIAAGLVTHGVFVLVLLVLILFQGLPVSLFFIQALYYLFCLVVLALGIGWAVSALNVFLRDVGQITAVILQMGFWATPIFWDISMMPDGLRTLFELNPMYYVVQGYRDSFLGFVPFWERPWEAAWFWAVASTVFVAGALIFKKLKPQFADVL
jgi:lipopolysaccharide transport system permease protein/teichoic acid transport system permease protein